MVGRVVDPETALIYLRARYYDPATAQFLTRDPLDMLTESAYGYVGDNPLNGDDPLGLCKSHGGIGGFVRNIACTTGEVATGAGRSTVAVAKVGGALVGLGVADVIGPAVNFADTHLGVSATACAIVCIGIEVQNGNFYFNYGVGAAFGASAGVNYYSHSLDTWCTGKPTMGLGFGPVTGSVDLANGRDWSMGGGPGMLFGSAVMHAKELL